MSLEKPFHVVLVEPEIPPNTGNIARLCMASNTTLHLVEPFGFRLDDATLKRAGMDYWHEVDARLYKSYDAVRAAAAKDAAFYFLTAQAARSYLEPRYREDMSKLAARHLLEAEVAASGLGVEPALLHEEEESPSDAIVRVASERACDLIVMSSHGRTGFAGLLIGSETRKVLAISDVPVLVCRPRAAA